MNKDDFVIFAEPGDFPVDKVKRKNALLKKFHCECETIEERQAVLKELFGAVGRNPRVTPLFYCDLGFNIFIGDDFYSNYNLTILDCAKVTIGNNCYIADNVGIYAVGHPTDRLLRRVDIEYGAPVVIGDDVWIGGHSGRNDRRQRGYRQRLGGDARYRERRRRRGQSVQSDKKGRRARQKVYLQGYRISARAYRKILRQKQITDRERRSRRFSFAKKDLLPRRKFKEFLMIFACGNVTMIPR